ncbi:MAG: hypothetical protein ACYTGZ_07615 [Planctomycetota bacterium]
MSTVLLTGQGTAARAVERAEVMRDMAELIGFRLNMVVLQPDEYEDGDRGDFPASSKSTRLVDEEEIFGDRFEGYRWEVTIQETIGAGASGSVSIDGEDVRGALFDEEGGAAATDDEGGIAGEDSEQDVEADAVDRMLLITVTVYPPGWDEADRDDPDAIPARTAWTAVHLPSEMDETGTGPGTGPGAPNR